MKVLINHSNHPSDKWDDEQRMGWDRIFDLPFPNISPEADTEEVLRIVHEQLKELKKLTENIGADADVYVMLQGEFTYCYIFRDLLNKPYHIAIPTTRRDVVEIPDGTKVSKFRFVRWRILD